MAAETRPRDVVPRTAAPSSWRRQSSSAHLHGPHGGAAGAAASRHRKGADEYRRHRLGAGSAALVLLMTPGLAFFYGGMVRAKSVLNMMMMNFGAIGVVSVLWVLRLLAGLRRRRRQRLLRRPRRRVPGHSTGLIGTTTPTPRSRRMAFVDVPGRCSRSSPPALISGAIADRAKFARAGRSSSAVWATVVYFPIAHWVFDFGDATTARRTRRLDRQQPRRRWTSPAAPRSTSTPVPRVWPSRSCWASATAGRKDPMRPHNLPLVMLGAGLLWFGWFGFNAGSALAANDTAAVAFVNTMVATARRDARLADHGEAPRRSRHHPGCRLRRGRRPGRHHPGLCVRRARSARSLLGLIAGAVCALAVGLKSGSASTTRSTSSASTWSAASAAPCSIGFFGHRQRPPAAASTACSTAAASTSSGQAGRRRPARCWCYSFVLTYIIGMVVEQDDRASGSSEEARSRASTSTEHAESGVRPGAGRRRAASARRATRSAPPRREEVPA